MRPKEALLGIQSQHVNNELQLLLPLILYLFLIYGFIYIPLLIDYYIGFTGLSVQEEPDGYLEVM